MTGGHDDGQSSSKAREKSEEKDDEGISSGQRDVGCARVLHSSSADCRLAWHHRNSCRHGCAVKVGFIGLGAMGRALARHLPSVCELSVYDLNPTAMEELAAHGAQPASSPAQLGADKDVVFLCLPRSADVETVLFGEAGLESALAPGSIVIDQTSGIPSETRRFAARLAQRGIAMLDAPVAGGVPGALAGTITIMMSGDVAAYEAALPLLHGISPNVYRCSDRVGDAQALKSINNIINAAYRVSTLEIVAVGRAMGLSMATMAQALHENPGRNFMTAKMLPALAEGRASTDFSMALMVKDLNQAIALSEESRASTPLSDLARGLMLTTLNMAGPNARLEDIVPFMERLAGQSFTGAAETTGVGELPAPQALELLSNALAAVNQLIVLENAAMATRAGLDLAAIEPILANGSAYSLAAGAAFAAARGEEPVEAPLIGATIETLTQLATIATRKGIPLLITNTVRALYLEQANVFGAGAGIFAMVQAVKPSLDRDDARGAEGRPLQEVTQ